MGTGICPLPILLDQHYVVPVGWAKQRVPILCRGAGMGMGTGICPSYWINTMWMGKATRAHPLQGRWDGHGHLPFAHPTGSTLNANLHQNFCQPIS